MTIWVGIGIDPCAGTDPDPDQERAECLSPACLPLPP